MPNLTLNMQFTKPLSKKFSPSLFAKVAVRSMNRTIKSTKTKSSNIIRRDEGWKVKKRDLDPRLSIRKATRSRLTAELIPDRKNANTAGIGRKSFSLTYFGAKEVRSSANQVLTRSRSKNAGLTTSRVMKSKKASGVTVQVKKGGTKAHFPKGFLAQMPGSGKVGAFINVEYPKWTGKLRELRTVSVTTMFMPHIEKLKAHARKVFKKEWRHEVRRAIKKVKGR